MNEDPKNIWFTADLHLGHKNMTAYRKCASVEEMNETLVANWNSRVNKEDNIFILGDVSFCGVGRTVEYLQRLNGRKYLVAGNHDRGLRSKLAFTECFIKVVDYLELHVQAVPTLILFHYPIASWDGCFHDTIHLHGHTHGGFRLTPESPDAFSLDVGVDCHNFKPISLSEILNLKEKGFVQRETAKSI